MKPDDRTTPHDLVHCMPDDGDINLSRMIGVLAVLLGGVVLYIGQPILLPLTASILLCFILGWLATGLERLGVRRPLSVIVVVVLVFGMVSGIGWMLFHELVGLSQKIPGYRATLVERVHQLQGLVPLPFTTAGKTIRSIGEQLSQEESPRNAPPDSVHPAEAEPNDRQRARADRTESLGNAIDDDVASLPGRNALPDSQHREDPPVKVDVVSLPPTPWTELASWFGPLVRPMGSLTMVIVLTIFLLLEREDFRNRLVRLMASSNLAIATTAITEATQRTALWLRMMCLINAIYAAVVGIGLYLVGLPNPLVWGVLAFVFRFVPFLGGWACSIIPILLSFAVFHDWFRPLTVIALYVTMDFVVNSILEPWLYGRPIGLTSVGVVLAVIFWAWLWGPVGLLLAVPMTLWLVAFGRYVPQLSAFTTLLGDTSDMPSYHTLYQRLLAYDEDESLAIWDRLMMDRENRSQTFDQVLLPLLQRAAADHRAGFISDRQQAFIVQTISEGLDEIAAEQHRSSCDSGATESAADRPRILVQPLRTSWDEVAARFLVLVLDRAGEHVVSRGSRDLMSGELLERIAAERIDTLVISAVCPVHERQGTLLIKKLRSSHPELKIVRAYWQTLPGVGEPDLGEAEVLVRTLGEAIDALRATASMVRGVRSIKPPQQ